MQRSDSPLGELRRVKSREVLTTSERAEREASLKVLLRCSPAVFLVHDLEGILKMERFWRENRDRIPIPAGLKSRIEATTTAQMAAAVAFVFAASCYPSYQAARSPIPGARIDFFNTMILFACSTRSYTCFRRWRSGAMRPERLLLCSYPCRTPFMSFTDSARRMCLPLVTCTERWS